MEVILKIGIFSINNKQRISLISLLEYFPHGRFFATRGTNTWNLL